MRCAGLFKDFYAVFQSPDFVKQDTDDFCHVDLNGRNLDCDRERWLLGLLGLLSWGDDFVHSRGGYFFVGDW